MKSKTSVIDKTKQIGEFMTDSYGFNFVLKLKSSSSLSIHGISWKKPLPLERMSLVF